MILTHTDNSFKTDAILKVDSVADAIRLKVVGDPVRVKEYEVANNDATAYKTANYTGTVPQSVQSWADAKGWTTQQACDDILAQSTNWYAALYKIRDLRLKAKESIRNATSSSQITSLLTTYEQQITALTIS